MQKMEIQKILKTAEENKNLVQQDPFILKIEGSIQNDRIVNKMVFGEAIEVILEEGRAENSQMSGYIPATPNIVIVQIGVNSEGTKWENIYVFNRKGWQFISN